MIRIQIDLNLKEHILNWVLRSRFDLIRPIWTPRSDCGPTMVRPWSDHGPTLVRPWSDLSLAETEIEFADECFLNHRKSSSRSQDIVI